MKASPSWSLARSVDPADAPLTLAQAKAQCGVVVSSDDALLDSYRLTAADLVELLSGEALLQQTWVRIATGFPDEDEPIALPRPPLVSVTSVQYRDQNGALQTWEPTKYRVISVGRVGYIVPAFGQCYPATDGSAPPDAVTITFVCGRATAATVPAKLMLAQRLLVAHWYANRETVNVGNIVTNLPFGVDLLIGAPARVDPCW